MTDQNTNTAADTHAIDDDHAAPKVTQMDSWRMSTSILVGLNKAIQAAQAEHAAIFEASGGDHFAPGLSSKQQIVEALIEAKKSLSPDLHRIARSSGYPLPEGV